MTHDRLYYFKKARRDRLQTTINFQVVVKNNFPSVMEISIGWN